MYNINNPNLQTAHYNTNNDLSSLLHEVVENYELNYDRSKADPIFKTIIHDLWDDCLRLIIPDADNIFDFNHPPEFIDKELQEIVSNPENGPNRRYADTLIKARLKNGTDIGVVIHLEVQGYNKPEFPRLMFEQHYRIYDKYKIPVIAAVIFTHDKVTIPDHYEYSLAGTQLYYRYNTYHVYKQDEKMLEESDNPFAQIVLIAKKAITSGDLSDNMLKEQKIEIFKKLITKNFSKNKIAAIFLFLKTYIHFAMQEMNTIFDNEILTLTKNNVPMTMLEYARMMDRHWGREEGREEKNELIKNAIIKLHSKMGLTEVQIADVLNVNTDVVNEVIRTIN